MKNRAIAAQIYKQQKYRMKSQNMLIIIQNYVHQIVEIVKDD